MAHCIFCGDTTGKFTTREHILPESLGGGDWAILPEGLFCDVCQNRFGSEIEQQALGDYPFSFFRVFIGIPTKKGKAPWFNSWEGIVRASLQPGTVGFDPAQPFEEGILNGKRTQICLLAHPLKPDMICRFLLKMGIEVIAADNTKNVFQSKYNPARDYALTGDKKVPWWYLQNERMDEASHYIKNGVTMNDWFNNVNLEVIKLDEGGELFHLSLLYLDFIVPITSNIQPQLDGLPEPEFKLFRV